MLNSDSGRAAAYESLRINTSKQMTSFHDFRMPRSYPTYAAREQVLCAVALSHASGLPHQRVSMPSLPESISLAQPVSAACIATCRQTVV